MLDFGHGSGLALKPPDISDRINEKINAGLVARHNSEAKRKYLGASRLGEPCERKLCYEYSQTPVDPGKELDGNKIRIFDAGHALEDYAAEQFGTSADSGVWASLSAGWMRSAGFNLVTKKKSGAQFGWSAIDGKMRGHIDGAIFASPLKEIPASVESPVIWEAKSVNQKSWNKFKKYGVQVTSETYFGQAILNLAYLECRYTLFTITNKNTSELHHELIEIDNARAQNISDKGLRVIQAVEAGELLPRAFANADFYLCKWCPFALRCWTK